jgi:cytochrome c oxidase subunit IV
MEEGHKDIGYIKYVGVWLGLLALTALTITVAGLHLGNLSTVTAVVIATVKASLVLWFFMHLKDEPLLLRLIFAVSILTLTVIILMTFTDVWFR